MPQQVHALVVIVQAEEGHNGATMLLVLIVLLVSTILLMATRSAVQIHTTVLLLVNARACPFAVAVEEQRSETELSVSVVQCALLIACTELSLLVQSLRRLQQT